MFCLWCQINASQQYWLYLVRFILKSQFISKIYQIWSKMVKNDWIFDWFWHFWLNSTIFDEIINIRMIIFNLLIEKWSKKDQNQSTLIEIISKLRSSIWSHCLNPNQTEINDQNRPAWNPNCRLFNSRGQITLA